MRVVRRKAYALCAVVMLAAACSSAPEADSSTVLSVQIAELPVDVQANVRVVGPGLDKRLSASENLSVGPGLYTLEIAPVPMADGAKNHPVADRLEVNVSAGQRATANARYGIVVPDTTKILDAQNLGLASDIAGPVLAFTLDAPQAATFAPGQVLVTGVGPRTPQGLLRKVVSVERGPDRVQVRTEPATLPDAVPVGELTVQRTFGDATVPNFRRQAEPAGTISADFPLGTSGLATGSCNEAQLSGALRFDWQRPSLDFDWKWHKVFGVPVAIKKARFAIEAGYLLAANYEKSVVAECSVEIVKPDIPYVVSTFVVPVGPVPVPVSLTLQVVAKAGLAGEAASKYALSTGEKATLGLEYRNGDANPIVDVSTPKPMANLHASINASVKFGLRTTLAIYGITGPYLDLTVGARAKASTDRGVQGCGGLYGDIGWSFTPGVLSGHSLSIEQSDFIALERQLFPEFMDKCPLSKEPADARKVLPHRKKVTLDDYQWMIGTWERRIEDPSGNKDYLRKETLTVAPDGQVTIVRQSNLDLGYQNPIRCTGALAFTDTGVLVVDTSPGPAEYLFVCHTSFDDHEIVYLPATETIDKERLEWFGPIAGVNSFNRVN